jgi:hypothetical protein
MSLCLSDGGYLFCEPDWWQENKGPANPEQHAWYPEWNKILGKAIEPRQDAPNSQGVYMREFEKGWAVFQPAVQRKSGAVDLSEEARSVRNGNKGTSFILLPGEGDLFVKTNRSQD